MSFDKNLLSTCFIASFILIIDTNAFICHCPVLVPRIGDLGSTVKDTVNEMVKTGSTLAKDLVSEEIKRRSKDETDLKKKMRSIMRIVARSWRDAVAAINAKLFDGSASSIAALTALIDNGNTMVTC